MSEQTIFTEALEIEGKAERSAFLERACGADAALRQRIERLLARHGEEDGFLDRPALAPAATGAYTPAPAVVSGRISCCRRSARAAWGRSGWPSSRSRSADWSP